MDVIVVVVVVVSLSKTNITLLNTPTTVYHRLAVESAAGLRSRMRYGKRPQISAKKRQSIVTVSSRVD